MSESDSVKGPVSRISVRYDTVLTSRNGQPERVLLLHWYAKPNVPQVHGVICLMISELNTAVEWIRRIHQVDDKDEFRDTTSVCTVRVHHAQPVQVEANTEFFQSDNERLCPPQQKVVDWLKHRLGEEYVEYRCRFYDGVDEKAKLMPKLPGQYL